MYKVTGVGGEMEVFEDKVELTPKGLLGVLNKGLKGTKTIPFVSITAVQHKKAGLMSGYLQFTLPGGSESRGGIHAAARDENTFMYAKASSNALVAEIKEYIERRCREIRNGAGERSTEGPGLVDQLAKLGDLRRSGVLSEVEFERAKHRLLSGSGTV